MSTDRGRFLSFSPQFHIKMAYVLQIATLLQLLCSIVVIWKIQLWWQTENQHPDNPKLWDGVDTYGYVGFMFLFCFKMTPCLSIPFTVMSTIAITVTNLWPDPPKLEVQKSNIPNICFRVVTRGLYKNLVIRTLERNIETCLKTGLEKFNFEVVTDFPLELRPSMFVQEIVVPKNYATKLNSQFKARALHYCLEKGISNLSEDDWIVHLDEETLLTQGSVIGLANFAAKSMGDIGQGVITYANTEIINWCTTLADSVRVAIDIGLMKFCFQKLHRPIYGLKGSYIIIKCSVEKQIGFDYGPKGSIAEDLYLALEAWKHGYKFNFVEGEMWEKSPFTIIDYIRQRKRWFVGRMFTILSPNIPLKYKLLLIPSDLSWLLIIFNIFALFVPLKTPDFMIVITSWTGGVLVFLFIFGSIKSFSLKRYGLFKKVIICVGNIMIIPLVAFLDGIASLWGFIWNFDTGFHIVQKEHNQFENAVEEEV
ncbi:hypothetical protein ACJMK2_006543 [Sinanodonta woodiana]|uniref:Glycosyltransferase 2-like domain-containing protein n=1 Tax=Sinanodonta woodiana TaxID=1069815 RepID=A0ABD3VUT5_SINWO